MKTIAHARSVDDLVGTYRTFGEVGPAYHVLRMVDEQTVRVGVVESGEELDYPVHQAQDDPEAE